MKFGSTPAWSLRPRRSEKSKELSPGPGAYHPHSLRKSSPSYGIGSSHRSDFTQGAKAPGPGTYNQETRPTSARTVFGKGKRPELSESTASPGPGTYETGHGLEGPQYSLRPKTARERSEAVPGPGAYQGNFLVIQGRAPQWAIGTSQRESLHSQSLTELPGPGHYPSKGTIDGPLYGFGKQQRSQDQTSTSPGAGAYEATSTLSRQGYSMRAKFADTSLKETAAIPGPGAYNPTMQSARISFKVGSGNRSDFTKGNVVPGPGTYTLQARPSSAKAVFGKGSRPTLSDAPPTPGPGTYQGPQGTDGPQYSMRPRTAERGRPTTPGPGHYDSKDFATVLTRSPSYAVGQGKRTEDRSPAVPGPGHYVIPGSLGGPLHGFGSTKRENTLNASLPSPGDYDLPSTLDRKGYSMSGRRLIEAVPPVPGPGAYQPANQHKAPAFSVGKGSRSNFTGAQGPGPGQYTLRSAVSPGVK